MIVNKPFLSVGISLLRQNSNIRELNKKFEGEYKKHINIPYDKDNNKEHKYDIFYAKEENRKNICIINFHGGFYMFGSRKHALAYYEFYLKNGYDVVTIDYIPNGKNNRGTEDIILDCTNALNHLFENLKKYHLDSDMFVLTGDSAGGHLVLLLTEMIDDKKVSSKLGYTVPRFIPLATIACCPVFDYESIGDDMMTDKAKEKMFGKNYTKEKKRDISPKTYINSISTPLFVSTCKNDFLIDEAKMIKNSMQGQGEKFKFVCVDSDNKKVGHVHNVTYPNLEESKMVNEQIIEFIEKNGAN